MMQIVFFLVGCLILYFIIRFAVDHSDTSYYLKKNNMYLQEILDLLKEEQRKKADNSDGSDEELRP